VIVNDIGQQIASDFDLTWLNTTLQGDSVFVEVGQPYYLIQVYEPHIQARIKQLTGVDCKLACDLTWYRRYGVFMRNATRIGIHMESAAVFEQRWVQNRFGYQVKQTYIRYSKGS